MSARVDFPAPDAPDDRGDPSCGDCQGERVEYRRGSATVSIGNVLDSNLLAERQPGGSSAAGSLGVPFAVFDHLHDRLECRHAGNDDLKRFLQRHDAGHHPGEHEDQDEESGAAESEALNRDEQKHADQERARHVEPQFCPGEGAQHVEVGVRTPVRQPAENLRVAPLGTECFRDLDPSDRFGRHVELFPVCLRVGLTQFTRPLGPAPNCPEHRGSGGGHRHRQHR